MTEPNKDTMALALEKRIQWTKHLDFVILCIGYAVGLGNVWRFPHLCYTNGGGAFLIPYFTCLVALGMPIFFLEIVFGQFTSTGTISAFEINPLFKGLGFSMVLISAEIAIYYNVIVGTSLYYLISSFQTPLPWVTCNNDWNTCICYPLDLEIELFNTTTVPNCTELDTALIRGANLPSHEFFFNKVLNQTSSIADPGGLKLDLTACNFAAWVLVYLSIIQGIKSMGKVAYVSAIFPYFLMTALLIKGATLEGAGKGVEYYMTFDLEKITPEVWKAAASQVLFSLSCCMGSLMAMSSYNDFHSNCIRDTFIVSLINSGTSFYVGFAIFTILGHMSKVTGIDISEVATSGPGLIFVVYPSALAQMPFGQFWSFLFFLMMVLLGLGSQFPSVETVVTSLQDEYPWLRKKGYNNLLRMHICLGGFLLGLPMTTRGGWYVLDLFDTFVEFPLLLAGLFEIVVIVWIYGVSNFSEDVMLMLGYSKINRIIFNCYFKWTLVVITPIILVWIIGVNAHYYTPVSEDDAYPDWAEILGWMIFLLITIWTPIWYIIAFWKRGGCMFLWMINRPSSKWGPADPENWTIPRYQFNTTLIVDNCDESEPSIILNEEEQETPVMDVTQGAYV